ncbi:hypothetical protein BX600DRAFT_110411 [Xylariales sp. PMI_506]|nr:hypothetical protein BX600DRAFT_110411 [Xylariales sp. PMI_506]
MHYFAPLLEVISREPKPGSSATRWWMLSTAADLDLFCNIILVLYLLVYLYLNKRRIRFWLSNMSDVAWSASPTTPTKKLFKAAAKTKTPLVRRETSTPTTPRSNQKGDSPSAFEKSAGSSQKFVRKVSSHSSFLPRDPDDIVRSTTLAPLTSKLDVAEGRIPRYAASATDSAGTGETPIGLIDNDVLTPTETNSRSIHTVREFSQELSESMSGAIASEDQDWGSSSDERRAEASKDHEGDTEQQQHIGAPANVGSDPFYTLEGEKSGLPEELKSGGALTNPPVDIAAYFAEQGNPEMSEFVKALTATQDSPGGAAAAADTLGSAIDLSHGTKASDAATKVPEEATRFTENGQIKVPSSASKPAGQDAAEAASNQPERDSEEQSLPDDGEVASIATQQPSALEKATQVKDAAASLTRSSSDQNSTFRMPDPLKGTQRAFPPPPSQGAGTGVIGLPKPGSGTPGVVDNMGRPVQINRSMEFPLPMPEKPSPAKSGLDMREVDQLASTDDLANVDDMQDPPEEFLDPKIHSPEFRSAEISPIPKISKVLPITSQPPPDLSRLAHGLGGFTVDDVGCVVNDEGKVLGHVTGDLPALVGRKVADNGEIYGDRGELIGFVTENLTGHPPPEATPLPGGLTVDIDGNIRDRSGNIIGALNNHRRPQGNTNKEEGPQPSKAISPLTSPQKEKPQPGANATGDAKEETPKGEKDEKENNGIPADIFLDVKSTADGIQLTIRIPTVFKQETRQTTV